MLTIAQTAKELNVATETIYNWHKAGKIDIIFIDKHKRYVKLEEVEKIAGRKIEGYDNIDFSEYVTISNAAIRLSLDIDTIRVWEIKNKIVVKNINGAKFVPILEINRILSKKVDKDQRLCRYCNKVDSKRNFIKYRKVCLECVDQYNKDVRKGNSVKSKYNISLEEYNQVINKSNNCCEICGEKSDKICYDHDHKTGKSRGALCHKCNSGIGLLKDDISILQKAIDYLRKHEILNTNCEDINVYYSGAKKGVLPT